MSLLGLLFLLVVLAGPLVREPALSLALTIASWVLRAAFVAEFVVRLWLADDRVRFLRRNWWQIPLLAVPALRFIRLLRLLRLAAVGRAITSALTGSRSAGRLLTGRLGWLAAAR